MTAPRIARLLRRNMPNLTRDQAREIAFGVWWRLLKCA